MAKGKKDLQYGIEPEQLQKFVDEYERQVGLASEYQSGAGQFVKNQLERLGMDPAAWQRLKSLKRKAPDRRVSILAQELDSALKLGFFDQLDAFHPLAPVLREILFHVEANDNRVKPDALVSDILGA